MWTVRKAFWNMLNVKKFGGNKKQPAPVPTDEVRRLCTIPMRVRYPRIPIDGIPVADHVPADENKWRNRRNLLVCRAQVFLYRVFPPCRPGLPSISADPFTALRSAYGSGHRAELPVPALPPEYQAPIDLGALAVAGPYSDHLQAVANDEPDTSRTPQYEWDFRHLGQFEHHHGLLSLGLRVLFELDEEERRLTAVEIDCELGPVHPGDVLWEDAQKLALCAATNHLTLVRHFTWIHLAAVAQSSVSLRNCLPADHRLRRLLWPHLWGTQYSSELVTEIMLGQGGDFESIFSFTHGGLCELVEDAYQRHDITTFDPYADAERRGLKTARFDQPSFENRRAHFDVMQRHTRNYLSAEYQSDARIRADASIVAWVADLERRLPGGVKGVVGDEITVEGVAQLAAILIYVATVEHEVMGTGLWNYQVWSHVQPTRVRRDGRRISVDVYQRLVNFNFMLNVNRAPLLDNFSKMAIDRAGAVAFRSFQADLEALKASEWQEPYSYWRMSPDILEASVNG